jgi:hypothetical protein
MCRNTGGLDVVLPTRYRLPSVCTTLASLATSSLFAVPRQSDACRILPHRSKVWMIHIAPNRQIS